MNKTGIELRFVVELRAITDVNSRTIKGTAVVFNVKSVDLGGFQEIVLPEAITQELIDRSDIVMLFNHNGMMVPLARSRNGKGSLMVTVTDTGVDFEFEAKNTALGTEVLEAIKAGDLSACSFAFRVAENGCKWVKVTNEMYLRTISEIDLIKDLSIVIDPAYTETSCDMRGLTTLKENETLVKDQELKDYYSNLQSTIINVKFN
jgi:HK97 family phage prohead protease